MQMLSPEQRNLFETAVSRYQSDLAADTAAQEYLASRGITPAAAHGARLGVVRHPIVGHESRRGRLAIPYLTPAGVVNFRFRCLRPHVCKEVNCPKYLPVDGFETNLYNVLDLKKPGDVICVAEGEIDALTLSMAGLSAVGVPGAKSWKKHWSKCLEDFAVIYVFGDPDDAGKGLAKFLAKEARARSVSMPQGKDVNDVYREHGAAGLRRLIE